MAQCRICLEEEGRLVQPCRCKGFDHGYFHQHCIETWVEVSNRTECEICKTPFRYKESCGFAPEKYCSDFFTVPYEPSLYNWMFRSFLLVLGFSTIIIASMDIVFLSDFVVYSTLALFLGSVLVQIRCEDAPFFMLDLALLWKSATSIAIICIGTLYTMNIDAICYTVCKAGIQSTGCTSECPVFEYYDDLQQQLSFAIYLDLISFIIIFVFRAFVRCFTHMRNAKFEDYVEEV